MPYKNKDNKQKHNREYNKQPKRKEQLRGYRIDNRQRKVKWFREYKSTLECETCGEKEPCCLVFHHKDPSEKRYAVSMMAVQGYSIETIEAEIAKCTVLCANCHAKVHAGL